MNCNQSHIFLLYASLFTSNTSLTIRLRKSIERSNIVISINNNRNKEIQSFIRRSDAFCSTYIILTFFPYNQRPYLDIRIIACQLMSETNHRCEISSVFLEKRSRIREGNFNGLGKIIKAFLSIFFTDEFKGNFSEDPLPFDPNQMQLLPTLTFCGPLCTSLVTPPHCLAYQNHFTVVGFLIGSLSEPVTFASETSHLTQRKLRNRLRRKLGLRKTSEETQVSLNSTASQHKLMRLISEK